jgi:hypothetical protein
VSIFDYNSIPLSPTQKTQLQLLCLFLNTTMYIRWKTRETKQGTTAYCYLCSGERVAGKVKSSTLGYLGSIAAKASASQRAVFWETVATKLLTLELEREDRVRIEALIAQRVQRGKNPHGDADAV